MAEAAGVNSLGTGVLKLGGLTSRALPGGANVTVYKADGYSAENPLLRVVTTDASGKQSEQSIDPRRVNPSNATEDELLALNAYLADTGTLDSKGFQTGMGLLGGTSANPRGRVHPSVRRNFIAEASDWMVMQRNAGNLAGAARYGKLLDVYRSLSTYF
jgi:hypothetical protein